MCTSVPTHTDALSVRPSRFARAKRRGRVDCVASGNSNMLQRGRTEDVGRPSLTPRASCGSGVFAAPQAASVKVFARTSFSTCARARSEPPLVHLVTAARTDDIVNLEDLPHELAREQELLLLADQRVDHKLLLHVCESAKEARSALGSGVPGRSTRRGRYPEVARAYRCCPCRRSRRRASSCPQSPADS